MFGRSRSSEDIDIIVEKVNFNNFKKLWFQIFRHFECLNTESVDDAYHEYLFHHNSLRFSKKGEFIPNIEFKFPRTELDRWTLKEKKKVLLNKHVLYISPLELQIPFKLFLGTEKDIEDARHLYNLFKGKLNMQLLYEFNRKLKIEGTFNRYFK